MKTLNNKIQITFGEPKHGWLPTYLKVDNFELEIEISDIPLNPMGQLCDALIEINSGIKMSDYVLWHLEPFCYYLQIEFNETIFKLTVFQSKNLNSHLIKVKAFEGRFEEIILPLYRSVKKFDSYDYKSLDWERIDSEKIEQLTKLIKTVKHNENDKRRFININK